MKLLIVLAALVLSGDLVAITVAQHVSPLHALVLLLCLGVCAWALGRLARRY